MASCQLGELLLRERRPENADLLLQDMPKRDTILMNMNFWATTLETRFSGQDVEALGAVLMELTKMRPSLSECKHACMGLGSIP